MTMDIMPWLINMRKLDRYNIIQSYERWAEEVLGLCYIAGVSKPITEKGSDGDELARIIIMLSLERDLRDFMSAGKVANGSASELWNGVKQAKKKLVSPCHFLAVLDVFVSLRGRLSGPAEEKDTLV